MKEYFNSNDRIRHFFVLGLKQIIDDFQKSDSLSTQESKWIGLASKYIKMANDSILERMGPAYKRKVLNMARDNRIDIVGRYSNDTVCVSNAAAEDIQPALDSLRSWQCIACEKDLNFKNCAVYNMCLACDVPINIEGDYKGCPYKIDVGEEL